MPDISKLHKAIESAAPIDGVSIGNFDNKESWRIDFRAEATEQERINAQAIVSNWNSESWDKEYSWDDIRTKRNTLLLESDWTDLPNNRLDASTTLDWQNYRDELRDIPQTYSTPQSVIWQTKPS